MAASGAQTIARKLVYDLDEPCEDGRALLGGKGAGLAEMTALGVPVPAGFTISTDACRAFMEAGGELPEGLERELTTHIERLERRAGKQFGDPFDPLLLSVRSGAAISMPGMMDTILNLGLNDESVRGLTERTGNARFANDSYRRLIQMFGEVVDGIAGRVLRGRARRPEGSAAASPPTSSSPPTDLDELIATYHGLYAEHAGHPFPQAPGQQLARAIRAVFDSWNSPRAERVPPGLRHPGRSRHGGQRRADGVREQERRLGDGCVLHAQPVDRRGRRLRRVPAERTGRGRRGGDAHAAADRAARRADAGGVRRARRDARPPRAPLPRHAGHRVHRRGRTALHPPDPIGQAHDRGGGEGRRLDGRRGPDRPRRGDPPHRSCAARPAAASDARSPRRRRTSPRPA